MSQEELDAHVAIATGEDLRTIRKRGFSMLNGEEVIGEHQDNGPQVIDWDSDTGFQQTCFLEELSLL